MSFPTEMIPIFRDDILNRFSIDVIVALKYEPGITELWLFIKTKNLFIYLLPAAAKTKLKRPYKTTNTFLLANLI